MTKPSIVAAAAIVTVAGIASRLPSRPGGLTLAFASNKPA
jgi:hypothetical protein